MYNEDMAALAAEYVLGTLSADERIHADTLIATDPGFGEIVHQWQRRLGQLNVMLELADPPGEAWDKINAGGIARPPSEEFRTPLTAIALAETEAGKVEKEAAADAKAESVQEAGDGAASAGGAPLAAALLPGEDESKPEAELEAEPVSNSQAKPAAELKVHPGPPLFPAEIDKAEVFSLTKRLRRWRLAAAACGLVAIVLAAFIVLSQAVGDLIPLGALHVATVAAKPKPPLAPATHFVAVLQQEPSLPAFLLTIDPAGRMLTVRRVAAKTQAGHSYELWVLAPSSKPHALGIVGDTEYTQRPLPSDLNVEALRRARYVISFEPVGGAKSDAPMGPILFTGKLVESVPPKPKN